MNIETTIRAFLADFDEKLKDAGGTTEIYYAFSTLYDSEKWIEQCHQNIIEIYLRSKELLKQLRNGDSAEDVWPTLDDLSFHAAIFGCYYHMFDFILRDKMTEQGVHWNDPDEITANNPSSAPPQALEKTIALFAELADAVNKKDIIAQRRHLNDLYLATSQLQCIAARNRLGTKGN